MRAGPKASNATDTAGAAGGWPPGWMTLSQGIGTGRYIDARFVQLEQEQLWRRVWQIAARTDEIPQAGDFTVYEIADQSILLVRTEEGHVKAYHNVCPHRGTALGRGAGRFPSAQIMCPF